MAHFTSAFYTHITDTNMVSLAPRPKVRKEDKGFMTAEDLQTMLGCRRYAMMWILHTVEMRRNELLHLDRTDGPGLASGQDPDQTREGRETTGGSVPA